MHVLLLLLFFGVFLKIILDIYVNYLVSDLSRQITKNFCISITLQCGGIKYI